jgi:hypothetical protein
MSLAGKNRRVVVVFFLLAMTFCNVLLPLRILPKLRNGYQDFTIFYTGARLLRNGQASHLYDLGTQYRLQQTFTNVPIRSAPLPFNHPPFEALLFIPFTFLAYWPAYLLWTGLNLIMLAAIVILLRVNFSEFAAMPPVALGLSTTAFFPVAIGVIQGQDIILMLLLFVLAIISLDQCKDATAGALLGAGLFRPQLAVPLVLLFAVGRWRVLLGFVPVLLALFGLSVAVVGWQGSFDYVHFVLHLEGTGSRAFPLEAVPNLRGLVSQLPGLNGTGIAAHILIFLLSAFVLFLAIWRIRKGKDSIFFASSVAIVTTLLISFHSLVYDFSLLLPLLLFVISRSGGLISMSADVDSRKVGAPVILLSFLLLLTPIYVFLLMVTDSFFWFSLILLGFYFWLLSSPERGFPDRKTASTGI